MRKLRPSLPVFIGILSLCLPGVSSARDLSLEDRVKAQEAIERVYWSHRIWPKENPQLKPSFEQVIPESV